MFPLTILAEFRGIPAIAYTAYTREAMRALLPLARSGVQQVVLRGFDDTPERLRDLIEQTGARILGQRLLAVLVPRLEQAWAPIEMVDAITRLFHSPQSFRTVPHLAAAAGRQRGMLDRWLRRAGPAPAKAIHDRSPRGVGTPLRAVARESLQGARAAPWRSKAASTEPTHQVDDWNDTDDAAP